MVQPPPYDESIGNIPREILVDFIRPYSEATIKALRISRRDDFSSLEKKLWGQAVNRAKPQRRSTVYADLQSREVMGEPETEAAEREKAKFE